MPTPKLAHHKGLNMAYVSWRVAGGKRVFRYLGKWGSLAAKVRYAAFCRAWPDPILTLQPRSQKWPDRRLLTFLEREQTIEAWARETGIKATTIRYRLDVKGWSVEQSLTWPVKKWKRRGCESVAA